MNTQLDKPLIIWGIYAPTLPTDRKKWMKTLGEEISKDKGYRMIAGDFNFVTNTKLDKRGGRTDRGTTGSKEQKKWEKEFNIKDVWREQNLDTIGTTWSNGVKDEKKLELESIGY